MTPSEYSCCTRARCILYSLLAYTLEFAISAHSCTTITLLTVSLRGLLYKASQGKGLAPDWCGAQQDVLQLKVVENN